MIQLSNLVKVREAVAPKELNHFNQLRAVTITANLAPGYALGEALAFLEQTAREVLPDNGADRRQRPEPRVPRRRAEPRLVFVLALGFIYLVLAAQFESFRDPVHHHADGAAVDDRRARRAVADRRHAQRLSRRSAWSRWSA